MLKKTKEGLEPRCSRWDRQQRPSSGSAANQANRITLISLLCLMAVMMMTLRLWGGREPELSAPGVPPPAPREVKMTQEDIHRGELLLVNNNTPYVFPQEEELVEIYQGKSDSYGVQDQKMRLKPQALQAINQMMDDFRLSTGRSDVTVISAYRTQEYQGKLLKQYTQEMGYAEASRWCGAPGRSEHHTGLVVDLGLARKGESLGFDGRGQYAWIGRQCDVYGYIVRYEEEKMGITGFYGEPWHLRYVGIPHASLMKKKGLCLEEYIDWIKGFSWEGDHLYCGGERGTYEIYFVPADPSGTTCIPLPPTGDYKVSGNNVDGFIVTIRCEEG